MSSPSARMTEEIERLRIRHREEDGRVLDEKVNTDLAVFIRTNQALFFDPEALAKRKHTDYQEARTIFRHGKGGASIQPPLPNFDAIVQLGDNSSVTLRDARRSHLTRRRDLIVDQNLAQQAAYVREMTLLDTALGRLTSDADTFGDVMAKDYGLDDEAAG
jgi:hypothetical protein